MASSERTHAQEPCRNCADPTPGNYCPGCGQRKSDLRASLWTLVQDFLEDQFGLEHRTPRTLLALFLRPGHLTREYRAGRVVRYVQPLKLYLVSSVLLFLLVGVLSTRGIDRMEWGALWDDEGAPQAQVDTGGAGEPGAEEAPGVAPPVPSTTQDPAPEAAPPPAPSEEEPWIARLNVNTGNERVDALLRARQARLASMEPSDALREVARTFLSWTPTLLFLLLPVFAGLLKLLYIRHPIYYAEHFIFVLHIHAFLFGIFTMGILASLAGFGSVQGLLTLWAAIYLFLAMRRVYGQGKLKTGLKFWILGWCYLWILGLSVPVMIIASLLFGR